MKKIIFYTNQYFGQIGGEDKAGVSPELISGSIGAANAFAGLLSTAEISSTIVCGDNYYAENIETAREYICSLIEKEGADMLIAGPAFNAGRFGMACGDICTAVAEKFNIPTLGQTRRICTYCAGKRRYRA